MFTGIVQEVAQIIKIKKNSFYNTYYLLLSNEILKNLKVGASISVNGCCLTVTSIENNVICLDVVRETLKITNLKFIEKYSFVNIERAMILGAEISGHMMSGHIFCTAKVIKIDHFNNSKSMKLKLDNLKFMRYILCKGYIGIDGISMTIGNVEKESFSVNVIPETLNKTTLLKKKVESIMNIEIDSFTYTIVNSIRSSLSMIKKNL